jgi:hypothetical protein
MRQGANDETFVHCEPCCSLRHVFSGRSIASGCARSEDAIRMRCWQLQAPGCKPGPLICVKPRLYTAAVGIVRSKATNPRTNRECRFAN